MKKYIAPSLKAISISSEDIIQTSGETAKVPTTVVNGVRATGYQATSFNAAYGTKTSVAD
ncbi:MAG: hypothetical protein IJC10_01365 [Clostridia bacterium]|nr:hypothetical protein [Clostridia bacterium]